MPRSKAIKIDNDLTKGLITEYTALNFPENACTETDNCVFDALGVVRRRQGIDYEEGHIKEVVGISDTDVFTEYTWTGVAGDGTRSILVQQLGHTLLFYDISSNSIPSANRVPSAVVTLSSFIPSGSVYDPGTEPCSYTQGDGRLFVANKYTYPLWIKWNLVTNTIDSTGSITIKYRDFEGVEDSWSLTERKTTDINGLKSTYADHYYNLLNQSWTTADALSQWDAARTDVPSNADYVGRYRLSETDAFDNARVVANTSLDQRRAPQGHFLLELGNVSRTNAMSAEGFTLTAGSSLTTELTTPADVSSFPDIGNYTNAGVVDDTIKNVTFASGNFASHTDFTTNYIGKNFSSDPTRIFSVTIYGTNDQGFSSRAAGNNVRFYLYGKTGSIPPVNRADGVQLGLVDVNDPVNAFTSPAAITSNDTSTYYSYLWVIGTNTGGAAQTTYISEVEYYCPSDNIEFIRPESIAWYSGRLWYSGPQTKNLASNLYFTQIIQREDQYGKCYQNNDPTNEYFSDLLIDDGGVIRIPEMGVIRRLFPFQDGLLVLASNGVWLIRGADGRGFGANNYRIRNITSIGVDSPLSVINFKGTPMWWGKEGIYGANYNPQYDSYDVQSVTLTTIDTFFNDIPVLNRKYVKGVFSIYDNVAYWLFNDSTNMTSADYYKYNRVLIFDGFTKAFYPWTITTGTSITPKVRGMFLCIDPSSSTPPVFKFTTTELISPGSHYFTYSEFYDQSYLDWNTKEPGINDYSSYLISGYRIHGETEKYFQANYVFTFFNTETNSSCFIQGLWDFTNSGDSGKWSTPQQAYRPSPLYRNINHSRLKVRGKGKALQIKFYSESGKPFNIIGFSCNESVNGDI